MGKTEIPATRVIGDSHFGEWKARLNLQTTPEQDMACLMLEEEGLRFLVDFGTENAVWMAAQRNPLKWNRFLQHRFLRVE